MRNFFLLYFIALISGTGCKITHTKYASDSFVVGSYAGENRTYNFQLLDHNGKCIDSVPIKNASFACKHPSLPLWYVISEEQNGKLFTVQIKHNRMKIVDSTASFGQHPCTVAINAEGTLLGVGHYSSGNSSWWKVDRNGKIMRTPTIIQHNGSSIHPTRQQAPHVHQIVFSASSPTAWVVDLGLDKLYQYQYNNNTLQLQRTDSITITAGSGPRNLLVSGDEKQVFVLTEMGGTVEIWQQQKGNWYLEQVLPSDTTQFSSKGSAALVWLKKDEIFAASNRVTENSIRFFNFSPSNKKWSANRTFSVPAHPRYFWWNAQQKEIWVAGRDADIIQRYGIELNSFNTYPIVPAWSQQKPVFIARANEKID